MQTQFFRILCIGLFAILTMAVMQTPASAAKTRLETFISPTEPVSKVIEYIRNNELKGFEKYLKEIGLSGEKEATNHLTKWIGNGEVHKVDLLKEERLGNTFRRYFYIIRRNPNAYMYLSLHTVETHTGWVLYSWRLTTKMNTFFPDWVDPK